MCCASPLCTMLLKAITIFPHCSYIQPPIQRYIQTVFFPHICKLFILNTWKRIKWKIWCKQQKFCNYSITNRIKHTCLHDLLQRASLLKLCFTSPGSDSVQDKIFPLKPFRVFGEGRIYKKVYRYVFFNFMSCIKYFGCDVGWHGGALVSRVASHF